MKRLIVALVYSLYFVALAGANASPGHWTRGFSGKAIFAVAVDPNDPKIVYAAGDGGLFKSTDGGTTWTLLHVGSPDISTVRLLVIGPQHPQCLYVRGGSYVGGGGLFKSRDGGETWSLLPAPARLQTLVIDPQHPTVLYGGVFNEGFFKSVDGGVNWTMIGVQPGVTSWHIEVSTLVLDPTNPATLYAGALDGGVLRSTDAGTTWVTILEAGDNQPVEDARDLRIYSVNGIAAAPTQPTTLYVSTQGRGILKSTDGGTKWQELDRGLLYVLAVTIDPTAPAILYAATYDEVFLSTDSGEHWQNLQFPSSTPPGINAITVNPTGTALYVGTNNGVSVYRLRE
jgi:hypothetical protein